MFSSKEYLEKKTGPWGVGRFRYLQALVTEFQDTSKQEHKLQVLANLANFAYDPINYEHFRRLNILDLFLGRRGAVSKLSATLVPAFTLEQWAYLPMAVYILVLYV